MLPVDPEDPFWDDQRRNSQRLYAEEPKYKGTPVSKQKAKWQEARDKGFYKTKIKVNGEMYWRRVMPFSGDYADRLNLKNSNWLTREEFFGSKARLTFEVELKRCPKDDPAEILVDMLRRPKGAPTRTHLEERSAQVIARYICNNPVGYQHTSSACRKT